MHLRSGMVLPKITRLPSRNVRQLDPQNIPQSQGGQPTQPKINGVVTQPVIGVTTLILF